MPMGVEAQNTLGVPNFCPKILPLHLSFFLKNFQLIIYGNGIKTNFRLQYGALSEPKVASQALK